MTLVVCSGCAADGRSPWASLNPWRRPAAAASGSAESAVATDKASPASGSSTGTPGTAAAAAPAAAANPAAAQPANPAAMLAVLNELKGIGAIDQATQERLIEDLQKTDPALWPQMLEVFRASLAYRQKYNDAAPGELAQAAGPHRTKAAAPADPDVEPAVVGDMPSRPAVLRFIDQELPAGRRRSCGRRDAGRGRKKSCSGRRRRERRDSCQFRGLGEPGAECRRFAQCRRFAECHGGAGCHCGAGGKPRRSGRAAAHGLA